MSNAVSRHAVKECPREECLEDVAICEGMAKRESRTERQTPQTVGTAVCRRCQPTSIYSLDEGRLGVLTDLALCLQKGLQQSLRFLCGSHNELGRRMPGTLHSNTAKATFIKEVQGRGR